MFEKEIAVIGPTEVVKPFLALGVNCFETSEAVAAAEYIRKAELEDKIGLIYIAESLAEKIMPEIERVKKKELPAVFILPEYGSNKKLGLKRLENTMSRAIGKKI